MDSTLRASLLLSKITFGDFVTPFDPSYLLPADRRRGYIKRAILLRRNWRNTTCASTRWLWL